MPPTRYIFADLDALNQDVCKYMRANKKEFSDAELTKRFPISAYKLTKFLSYSDEAYFNGSYFYLKLKDVEAFRAVGWEMRPKSESKYRTLGNLPKPKRILEDDGAKTLVLVAGKLAGSVLLGVEKYFEAGWFRSLVKEISGDNDMMFTARDTVPDGDTSKSIPMTYKLSSLYEYIHELQMKVLAMEADSEAQRTQQHDNLHRQLQQQQEAFAYQLSKHDEDFQKRLKEHRKVATSLRKHHQQVIEERVSVCTKEIKSALSSLGELSERVKHDVEKYQRDRLDEELALWRRNMAVDTGKVESKSSVNSQDKTDYSTLLDAIDFALKQNGVATGIKNWRAALAVLVIHKITAWLSSANIGTDLVGVLATSLAIVTIASDVL
eukprot:jgi/Phyca11/7342/fgenesh1_pm.PHYCAscaffold_18_\